MPIGLDLVRQRGADYGGLRHDQKIGVIPPPLGRVLDVGCAEGANADVLRARGATQLAGIELDEAFAAKARERYDEVVVGRVPDDLEWADESFDTVLCYDILEHLYDPWGVTRQLARLLQPGGHMHVSLPNARSKELWLPLLREGRFRYRPEGIMDVTHLRFFGRRDAIDMVEAAGLRLLSVDHAEPETRKRAVASALTGGRIMDFLTIQWYVLARR